MSRIASVFKPGYKALIPYITAGFPDIDSTIKSAVILAENGSDIIELGIPFSDPLADGATIQRASYESLQSGTTPESCFEIAASIQRKTDVPLVFMTYYNPVLNYGLEQFCKSCTEVGIHGLIVPDLPPEEGVELEAVTNHHDLDLIYLLAPTSNDERIDTVTEHSRGFVYLVSLTGVTGARDALPEELEGFINKVRQKTTQPLCVGFGIATPEHARRVATVADGVIIGSRLVQIIEEDTSLAKLGIFISSLRKELDVS
jgi:tryptophan synthase alpha chain